MRREDASGDKGVVTGVELRGSTELRVAGVAETLLTAAKGGVLSGLDAEAL